MTHRFIVAGTDGTEHSLAAVEWAANEAQRRRVALRIVYTFGGDWHDSRFGIGDEYLDVARQMADAVVAYACDRARQAAPTAAISTDTRVGHPVPGLLDALHGAELLVLGNHGHGGLTGLLCGSVNRRMTARSPCPVAVVRGRLAATGRVVAGVGDTADAEQVVATAFEAAADRGSPLTVIHSYRPPAPLWPTGARTAAATIRLARRTGDRLGLEQRLLPWRDKYPQVPVEIVSTRDSAVVALVEASRSAQLVVVGRGGGSTVGQALPGSTVPQLLNRAECPVLIR